MSRLHAMTTNKRNTGDAAIEQLLEALDLEAASLSSDITGNLATARHQALATTRLGVSDEVNLQRSTNQTPRRQNVDSTIRSCASQLYSLPLSWTQSGYSLLRSMQVSPVSRTVAAGIGVASLTTLLVLDGPKPQDTRDELVAMASPDRTGISGEQLVQTAPPTLQATTFDTQPDEHLPLINSTDSLDLVGSVDFLLWLDSQQG